MPNIFSVERFKAAIGNGGARPNQFMVLMFPPGIVPAPGVGDVPFLTSSASLPGQVLNPAIVQYRGREVKFAGDRVFSPWTTTFLNDTSLKARTICENWMQAMENREEKVGATEPAAYYGSLIVQQLNRNGAVIKAYQFTDVLPIDISEVGLDFGANDQVSTFTCTWAYQQFDILPPVALGNDAPANVVDLGN